MVADFEPSSVSAVVLKSWKVTPGKVAMIEASRSPAEEILDHLRETLDGDLVTKPILENKVRAAARVLSHSRIENDPGGITRKL